MNYRDKSRTLLLRIKESFFKKNHRNSEAILASHGDFRGAYLMYNFSWNFLMLLFYVLKFRVFIPCLSIA